MPQIEQISQFLSSQVFWLLVFFGLTFVVVGLGMVPKILGTVEMRDNQIASDLAAAQAARDAATGEEEAWRIRENANRAAAQALIGEAKAKAAEASAASSPGRRGASMPASLKPKRQSTLPAPARWLKSKAWPLMPHATSSRVWRALRSNRLRLRLRSGR